MVKVCVILYFVIGLIMCHIGASEIEDERKREAPIPFLMAQIFFILFWPVCLLMVLGGNDDEE